MANSLAQSRAWEAHDSQDGRTYYHNTITGKTTWKRPPELDEPPPAAEPEPPKAAPTRAAASSVLGRNERGVSLDARLASASVAGKPKKGKNDPEAIAAMNPKQLSKFLRARNVEHEGVDGAALVELAIASAHLPKQAWQKVKTPDGKFYWFHSESKATSWTEPAELQQLS